MKEHGVVESKSWAILREALLKASSESGHASHIVRIENMVGAGIFDTNIGYKGTDIWLEGKRLNQLPVRNDTLVKVGLRGEQEAFALRRLMVGGRLFVWCRVNMDRFIKKQIRDDKGWYLIPLLTVSDITETMYGMTRKRFLTFRHNNVNELAAALLNGTLHDR